MDEILCDLLTKWIDTYNLMYDDDLIREDITSWSIHEYMKKCSSKDAYQIIQHPGFFDYLPPIPGAIEGFNALRYSGHQLKVCSSPAGPDSARAKHEWCSRHLGIKDDDLILMHDKHILADWADAIIDDRPATMQAFADAGKQVRSITYPYNAHLDHPNIRLCGHFRTPRAAWINIVRSLS